MTDMPLFQSMCAFWYLCFLFLFDNVYPFYNLVEKSDQNKIMIYSGAMFL